jgi:hypothetical protein
VKKILLIALSAISSTLLTSCTTITVDAPQPAELSLRHPDLRAARTAVVEPQ